MNLRLETARLSLRPMLATDIDVLHLIFTDPKVMASELSRYGIQYWKYAMQRP